MDAFSSIILANVAVSLMSLSGVILLPWKKITPRLTQVLVSFAAGVMLTTAFLDILPEALEAMDVHRGLYWVLAGVVGSFVIERFLWHHHHHNDTHGASPTRFLILFGDAIHNFIDGIAVAAGFLVNPTVGLTTMFAIIAHEIPQELADFSILLHTGLTKKRAVAYNFISALASIFGGVIGFHFLQQAESYSFIALAITGGVFIYIAAADLIPELHRKKHAHIMEQIFPFILGILLMILLLSTFAEH